jgi:hypothetical protein
MLPVEAKQDRETPYRVLGIVLILSLQITWLRPKEGIILKEPTR